MPATDEAGHSLFIGSMSNELGTSVPISIDSSYFKGFFSSLIPTGDVAAFFLPMALEEPDTIPGPIPPDGGEDDREAPGLARLDFGEITNPDQMPRIALLPVIFPIPVGIPFPDQEWDIGMEKPDITEACPLFEVWRKAQYYSVTHNFGGSITETGPLFDLGAIDQTQFLEYEVLTLVSPPVQMLDVASWQFRDVRTTIDAASKSAWLHLAETLPAPVPDPDSDGGGATTGLGPTVLRDLVQGLADASSRKSMKDEEVIEGAASMAQRFSLAFARLEPSEIAGVPP